MRYDDVLELIGLSQAAAALLWPVTVHEPLPPRYLLVRAVHAAAADPAVQGAARDALGRWLQTNSAWLSRPTPPAVRTHMLQVRLTEEELRRLKREAAEAEQSVAELVRGRVFARDPQRKGP